MPHGHLRQAQTHPARLGFQLPPCPTASCRASLSHRSFGDKACGLLRGLPKALLPHDILLATDSCLFKATGTMLISWQIPLCSHCTCVVPRKKGGKNPFTKKVGNVEPRSFLLRRFLYDGFGGSMSTCQRVNLRRLRVLPSSPFFPRPSGTLRETLPTLVRHRGNCGNTGTTKRK